MVYIVKGCYNTPEYNSITKRCIDCAYKYESLECIKFNKENNMIHW